MWPEYTNGVSGCYAVRDNRRIVWKGGCVRFAQRVEFAEQIDRFDIAFSEMLYRRNPPIEVIPPIDDLSYILQIIRNY